MSADVTHTVQAYYKVYTYFTGQRLCEVGIIVDGVDKGSVHVGVHTDLGDGTFARGSWTV